MLKSTMVILRNQFRKGNFEVEQFQSMLDAGDITQKEFEFIVGK